MKTLLLGAFLSSFISFNLWAKCPVINDTELNSDQLIVKNLLESAYKFQASGSASKNLVDLTNQLRSDFTQASVYLDEKEVSSFIVEQDSENNLCPNNTFISSATFNNIIVDKIIETYYGCGCEH